MDSFFDIVASLLEALSISEMNNDRENDKRPKNSGMFKFTLFLLSGITLFGIIGQLNLNPQLWAGGVPLLLSVGY